jgi:hypothetical protein
MNERDLVFTAFKEVLILFALISGVGAVVAGRYLAGAVILSVALFLMYEEPIARWRRKHLGF